MKGWWGYKRRSTHSQSSKLCERTREFQEWKWILCNFHTEYFHLQVLQFRKSQNVDERSRRNAVFISMMMIMSMTMTSTSFHRWMDRLQDKKVVSLLYMNCRSNIETVRFSSFIRLNWVGIWNHFSLFISDKLINQISFSGKSLYHVQNKMIWNTYSYYICSTLPQKKTKVN